jgi:ribokinase
MFGRGWEHSAQAGGWGMTGPVRALVVGSVNVDLLVRVPAHPGPGETVMGSQLSRLPGGKGGNQAVALARLGAQVRLHAAVGDDAEGVWSLEALSAEGVDVSSMSRIAGAPTGVAVVTVADDGANRIVVVAGANAALGTVGSLGDVDVLVAQLEVPLAVVADAAAAARQAGVPVVLNAAPARSLPTSLLADVDVLVVNEPELAVVGADVGPASLARAVVVTLGADGALVYAGGGMVRVPAPPADVVDTTGAGDCFVAALAFELARGRAVAAAAEFACRAASRSVTGVGARGALPTWVEVDT